MKALNWKEKLVSGSWEIHRHAVSLVGKVIDIERKKGITQIPIHIQSPGYHAIIQTRADGYFYFMDLPKGDYSIQAKLPKPFQHRRIRLEAYAFKQVDNNVRPLGVGTENKVVADTKGDDTDENQLTIRLVI